MKRISRRAGRVRGYTLVEVLVSVGIAGVVMLGALQTLTFQWNLLDRNQERLFVSHVLQSRLEEIRDLSFESLADYEPSSTFTVTPASMINGLVVNPDLSETETDYDQQLRNALGTIYVEAINDDLKRVTLEVTWDPAISESSVTMSTTTYISSTGVNRQ